VATAIIRIILIVNDAGMGCVKSCRIYHFFYFSTELNSDAREVGGELYCLRCHDTMGIPICGACRRPVEERVVTAMGKNWHVEVSW
jgi:hypothetical protein